MNSWHQLLLWNMAQGKYLWLAKRPVMEHDWAFWILVQDMQAREYEAT